MILLLIDHQKSASVFWISPFGQLVASNQSISVNFTAGFQMVEFPPNLQRMPGVWSAIFLDHDLIEFTEIEFLIISKKYMFTLKQEVKNVIHEVSKNKQADYNPIFLDTIKANKIANNHHSIAAIKSWMKTAYQLSNTCQVQTGSCHTNNWSSKSLDTKSTINFEL